MTISLRPPSLGPIVGHTTSDSARVWIRSAELPTNLRTVGIAGLMKKGGVDPRTVRYFRLQREYDRTGYTDIVGLRASTEYEARLGTLATDDPDPDNYLSDEDTWSKLPPPENWAPDLTSLPDSAALFRTFPKATGPFSFVFGSCLYPGVWFGQSKKADRIFEGVRKEWERKPFQFFLMAGDQIYTDKLNKALVANADTPNEVRDRYNDAFGAGHLRRLLARVPTYMMLDDHEIADNWSQDRLSKERFMFTTAITAYQSYQWLHSPRNYGKNFYYSFECGGHPFFALDTRTQRYRDASGDMEANYLLGYPSQGEGHKSQLDVFCDWLEAQQIAVGDRPKFVVTSIAFIPIDVAGHKRPDLSDSWPAFPQARRRILQTIVEKRVNNVVFLCGDIHVSNVGKIQFIENGQSLPVSAYSITSSAFYWPFPFADGDPNAYVQDSTKANAGFPVDPPGRSVTMHYRVDHFEQDDNFTRVDVEAGGEVWATQFDRGGKRLRRVKVI